MSVIQEALRRKQQEQQAAQEARGSGAARPAPPPEAAPPRHPSPASTAAPPPPMPRAMPAPAAVWDTRAPRRVRRRPGMFPFLVMILVLGGVAGLLAWYYLEVRPERAAAGTGPGQAGPGAVASATSPSAAADRGARDDAAGDWPEIFVGSVARSSSGNSSAIVNDRLLFVGEDVDRATLVEVQENGVVLEYEGARRFFRAGRR